jgi:thiamine-phosphate pyrophosphorylase
MKPNLNEIDLYFITDSKLTKKTVLDDVKAAIKGGVKIIQYREKEKSTKDMIKEARQIKEICNDRAIFLIDDRIDIALAVDADGVHLGNDDMPYDEARKLLGNKVIGLTIHNVNEAVQAEQSGADYIGVSPIFETKTKLDAGPAAGLELIRDVKEKVKIPFVAIGGINLENIDDVVKAGSRAAAVISAIVTKEDVEMECRKFIDKLKG